MLPGARMDAASFGAASAAGALELTAAGVPLPDPQEPPEPSPEAGFAGVVAREMAVRTRLFLMGLMGLLWFFIIHGLFWDVLWDKILGY